MKKIEDHDEVQFRQVHPSWMEMDGPSRQAFAPTRKDDGKLSMDRSATTDAKASFDNFKALGLDSGGVFGLTPREFSEEPYPVECFESPLGNNLHHSHAEFNDLSHSQKKTKAQNLRRKALARGKLHP